MTTEVTNFVPVIKMDTADLDATAKALRSACIDVGFFYLEGHGLSEDFLDEVMDQSRRLFDLSAECKEVLKDPVMSRGYTAMEEETLDPKRQRKGDTKEGFYIGADIAKEDSRYNPAKLKGPNCWPTPDSTKGEMNAQDCDKFRAVMEEYFEKMSDLGFRVIQLLARALELDQHYFDKSFQDPTRSIRLLHYAKETSVPEDGVFACGAHSDYGMITLLLTDEQPGLQINFRGDWIDVPPRPNAFVVNLGKMCSQIVPISKCGYSLLAWTKQAICWNDGQMGSSGLHCIAFLPMVKRNDTPYHSFTSLISILA
jgi:isopenicillin N synthase-like dioxygenase